MKKNKHPKNYRIVVFKDTSNDKFLLCRSTVDTKNNVIEINNKKYPLYKMEISSFSHPFFTGKMKYVDTEGRIEKFKKKYQKK
ncbi:type B 50S ribosomal protein L31 [Candidatus Shikimatogenerans silvanidophilus]|uniref:type B 50S ribosomal protein L31 n=1 Tax=Candidatus Shikimatogenerans silvanidophilus TaxID=2782547 RepID=UPI001BA542A5|nr:type B 50S ribosomal protein L31 [Candidatus Shikimatogenerans silvanidophilus]